MLNRTDTDFERSASVLGRRATDANASPCRELTVGEVIDERIRAAERKLKSLHDLKGNLPQNFLDSPASRIFALMEG